MQIGRLQFNWLDVLLVFVPLAVVLEVAHAGAVWIFACSCLAIIPLAGWMGRATEHLAAHFGAGVGGLLNATFGNAAELIIAIFALHRGLHDIVKASLTGSIMGNVLLVLGLSLLLGGFRYPRQTFNRTAAGLGSTLLALSAMALVIPAVFHMIAGGDLKVHEQDLGLAIAIVLMVTYALSLLFSLKTHRHLFAGEEHGREALESSRTRELEGKGEEPESQRAREPESGEKHWSRRLALIVLLTATALVALMSEVLVGSVEHAAESLGMSRLFVGVILVAIIGNAAEHSSAILMAMKNHMDLALNIALGSSIQIALFVAPALVFLSYAFGDPMDLVFTPFEVVAVASSVFVVSLVAHDGESHWMEGVLLLAVYVIVGIAFFFL